jgi:CheY-like chemotaxis protein
MTRRVPNALALFPSSAMMVLAPLSNPTPGQHGGRLEQLQFRESAEVGTQGGHPMIAEKERPKLLNHVRVLVVEDQQDCAEMLRHTLSRWGCDARVCQTGAAALDEASTYRPHVAVLDLNLPDIDGCEVGRCLRQQAGPDMALVALTGLAEEEDRRRSSDAGFDLHLLKHFRLDVLHSLLTRIEQYAW